MKPRWGQQCSLLVLGFPAVLRLANIEYYLVESLVDGLTIIEHKKEGFTFYRSKMRYSGLGGDPRGKGQGC